jgi:hypothetical protein
MHQQTSGNGGLNNHPLVVLIGVLAAIVTVVAFFMSLAGGNGGKEGTLTSTPTPNVFAPEVPRPVPSPTITESRKFTTDRDITHRGLFALFNERENFTDVGTIRVACLAQNGHCILSGSVASSSEKSLAEKIVRYVDGVKSVENNLTVGQ